MAFESGEIRFSELQKEFRATREFNSSTFEWETIESYGDQEGLNLYYREKVEVTFQESLEYFEKTTTLSVPTTL